MSGWNPDTTTMSTKTIKILYWVFNALFAAAMLLSSIESIMMTPNSVQFIHGAMGYPEFIIPLTGWLKVIGSIVILIPIHWRIKEWAYAGLFIDLFLALYSIGYLFGFGADSWPLAVYVVLAAGAYFFHVKKQQADGKAI
jgi:hypothetical protein